MPTPSSTRSPAGRAVEPQSQGASPVSPRLPEIRRVLGWVYIGRLCLTFSVAAAALWVGRSGLLGAQTATLLIFGVSGVFTAASFGYSHIAGRRPGRGFLTAQILHDTLLATAVVHLTGGAESEFAPVYLLVICAAALFFPLPGTLLTGVWTSALYLVDVLALQEQAATASVLIQVGLLLTVALVNGYLGGKLRQTGTALGEVETELRLLRLDTDDILDSLNTGIVTVDSDGRLMYLNSAGAELLDLSPGSWLGRPVLDELDRIAPGLGTVIGRSGRQQTPIRRYETDEIRNGSPVLGVSTTLMERTSPHGSPVTAVFQDITERRRMDTLRQRAERLEAVAGLGASLAHEIKNPLASIRSAVEQLASDGLDADDRQVLERLVVRESDRLSRLLTEFLDYSRVEMVEPQPVDLAALVRHAVDVVRAHPDSVQAGVRFETVVLDRPLPVLGSEDLLHRAVLNLVLNSAQWAGDRGRVEVRLDMVESDILSPVLGVSRIVRLSVSDSGPGVPPEIAERIFDPFFTRRRGGTGLGLALVDRVVNAHGGAIFVDEPAASTGATFSVYLPAHIASRGAEPVPALEEIWT